MPNAQIHNVVAIISNPQLNGSTVQVDVSVETDVGDQVTTSATFAITATATQMKQALYNAITAVYASRYNDTFAGGFSYLIFGSPL